MLGNEKLSAVNFTQEDSILQIYPHSPELSSLNTAWRLVHLAVHHQPAHQTPEYYCEQHAVCIHLGQSIILEQQWKNGLHAKEHQVYGDIGIYPAFEPLKEYWNTDVKFLELSLDSSFFHNTAYELTNNNNVEILPFTTIRDPLILHLGLALKAELESEINSKSTVSLQNNNSKYGNNSNIYVESIATTLIIHLLKHYSAKKQNVIPYKGGLSPFQLKQTVDYIREHLNSNLSLTEIAAVVNLSSHYFASLFKQSTGETPLQYINKCRIEKAKELLANQNFTITDVCLSVGFADPSHFAKVFRKYVGLTPKIYRKRL